MIPGPRCPHIPSDHIVDLSPHAEPVYASVDADAQSRTPLADDRGNPKTAIPPQYLSPHPDALASLQDLFSQRLA
jgi:hypothetical protein